MSDVDDTRAPNEARVRVVNGPLVQPVLSRVVGMLAARAQCPVDRLDDALLVADALAAHAANHVPDGHVSFRVGASREALHVTVADLLPGGAEALIADATLPGVGNVLERIADEVTADDGSLTVRLGFGS